MGLPTRDEAIDIGSETVSIEDAQRSLDQEMEMHANKEPLPLDMKTTAPVQPPIDVEKVKVPVTPVPEQVQGPTF